MKPPRPSSPSLNQLERAVTILGRFLHHRRETIQHDPVIRYRLRALRDWLNEVLFDDDGQ